MGATRIMLNHLLHIAFGTRAADIAAIPADYYFGLSTTEVTDITNISASVTAMSYLLKVVTLTAANIFQEGDSVVVSGVNAGFTVTNIDGTWTCDAGTNATTIVFTVTDQPVGTTPQTISVGTVTGDIMTEVTGGDYARKIYSNDETTLKWTVSTVGEVSNTEAATFTTSSAAWGTIVSVFLADASTNGNILWYYTLSPEIVVGANPTSVSFAIGDVIGSLA